MGRNRIVIGSLSQPLYTIEDNQIRSINETVALDMVGAELSADELVVELAGNPNDGNLIAPADYDAVLTSDGYLLALPAGFSQMRELPYGTEVRYYRDGKLRGLYYSKSVERVSASVYKLSAQSVVGLLSNMQHYGGVYNGERFSAVLTDILGNSIRSYSINLDVADTKIYGWLPIATKRDNLHQLLFATGAALSKDANGNPKFVFLDTNSATTIPPGRFYYGGTVDYSTPASGVEVTEHSFYKLSTDETITLFDNTDGSSQPTSTFVAFQDAPIYGLSIEGTLSISKYGVNYAVVSGIGILKGKKYTHATKVLTQSVDSANAENIISVSDVTLISMLNSRNVAKRLLSYYSSKKTIRADLLNEGEKPGQLVSFQDPYGDAETGYIAKAENSVSSILKSQCEIITDYVPEWHGNNYSSTKTYNYSTGVTLQSGSLCIIIGGGSGGYSGGDGYPGTNSTTRGSFPSPGGDGGVGGSGGSGGKIFAFEIVESGYYTFSVGSPGTGGTSSHGTEPTPGNEGGSSTLSLGGQVVASSASGFSSPTGYVDLLNGTIYATTGESGTAGATGGDRDDGDGYGEDLISENIIYFGGSPGKDRSGGGNTGYGGAGGGAAIGGNGSDGEKGHYSTDTSGATLSYAGAGGRGADATARTDVPTIYGGGGNGGHGGGGGGAAGTAEGSNSHPFAKGGAGGTGGKGGSGGYGCLIVYTN